MQAEIITTTDMDTEECVRKHSCPVGAGVSTGVSLRERQRQVREDAILDAAHELMGEQGYEAMTMDDLAVRVGISKPTLYAHFHSKEEVAVRAIVRMIRGARDMIADLDMTTPACDRLEKVLRAMIERKFIQRQLPLGSARAALVPVLKAHPDYQREFQKLVLLLSGLVEEGKREGTIRTELATRPLVQMYFSIVRDMDYEDMLTNGECTPEELTETVVGVMRGIRREGVPCV